MNKITVRIQPYMLDNYYAFIGQVRAQMRLANYPPDRVNSFLMKIGNSSSAESMIQIANDFVKIEVGK